MRGDGTAVTAAAAQLGRSLLTCMVVSIGLRHTTLTVLLVVAVITMMMELLTKTKRILRLHSKRRRISLITTAATTTVTTTTPKNKVLIETRKIRKDSCQQLNKQIVMQIVLKEAGALHIPFLIHNLAVTLLNNNNPSPSHPQ